MPLQTFQARCLSIEPVANDVLQIKLEKPAGFSFVAGQFVLFLVPLVDNPADIQPRAYSIASSPLENELLFIIKVVKGGRAGRWVTEMLKVGDHVNFEGPCGVFTLDPSSQKDSVFFATSSGVAPFRSQILTALKNNDRRPMDVFLGVLSEADLFWVKEFQDLSATYSNVRFFPVLEKPAVSWKGLTGYIQQAAPTVVRDFSNKAVYICGNPNMLKAVKDLCEGEWKIPKEDVHCEGYV